MERSRNMSKSELITCIGIAVMIILTVIKALTFSQIAAAALILTGLALFFIVEAVAKTPDAESGLRFKTFFSDVKKPGVLALILLSLALTVAEMLAEKYLLGSFGRVYVDHVLERARMTDLSNLPMVILQDLPPVVAEEIGFRGFFLGNGMKRVPFWPMALCSAACFAAAHIASGAPGIVIFDVALIFIDGLIFALIYRKTENCLISMIPHFINNVAGLLLVPVLFG